MESCFTFTAISICFSYWNLYHQFFERGNMETSSGLILCKGEILSVLHVIISCSGMIYSRCSAICF